MPNAVVWLDDIQIYLTAGGIDGSVVDALTQSGTDVVLLATLRSEAQRELESSDLDPLIAKDIREVMNRARFIRLDPVLSDQERVRAERLRHDGRIAAALDQQTGAGFAEYLAAGPATLDRWKRASGGGQRTAGAIIGAAVDARIAGHLSPLPLTLLNELYVHYLDEHFLHQPNRPGFRDSLLWAAQPVQGASSCLSHAEGDTYEPFDYLVDHVQKSRQLSSMPEYVWPALLKYSFGEDLLAIGTTARAAGKQRIAEDAFRRAVEPGDPLAMVRLADLLKETDRTQEAEQLYQRAAEYGYPLAMVRLSDVLEKTGREEQAQQWRLRAASDYAAFLVDAVTDPDGTPTKILNLEKGFIITGRLALPSWLTGTANVAIYAEEVRGPFDARLGQTDINFVGKAGERGSMTHPWTLKYPEELFGFSHLGHGSRICKLTAVFIFGETDIAGFQEMGLYSIA